jgi:hypothetical protein
MTTSFFTSLLFLTPCNVTVGADPPALIPREPGGRYPMAASR